LPTLSWQSVIVGDPLCRPFGKTTITAADLDPPTDKDTELPAFYSARRLAAIGSRTQPAAAKLILRSEARLARDDKDGARAALETAVKLDDSNPLALHALATAYESSEQYDRAIEIYRKLIERNPKDPVALNNLGYALAVRKGQPAEGLPYAERALLLARNPVIADTVGWIKYLLGDYAGAVKILEPSAKAVPGNADIQLHAAAAFAAVGRIKEAGAALKAAEAADPKVKERADYREIAQKIAKNE
jgi:Tfp pilus assembly protein PilF